MFSTEKCAKLAVTCLYFGVTVGFGLGVRPVPLSLNNMFVLVVKECSQRWSETKSEACVPRQEEVFEEFFSEVPVSVNVVFEGVV